MFVGRESDGEGERERARGGMNEREKMQERRMIVLYSTIH